MPKYFKNQSGVAHVLILLAVVGLLAFLLISNTFGFKDRLFSALFPKPSSEATSNKNDNSTQSGFSLPDQLMVKFKGGVEDSLKNSILAQYGLEVLSQVPDTNIIIARVPPAKQLIILTALEKNPRVLSVSKINVEEPTEDIGDLPPAEKLEKRNK